MESIDPDNLLSSTINPEDCGAPIFEREEIIQFEEPYDRDELIRCGIVDCQQPHNAE